MCLTDDEIDAALAALPTIGADQKGDNERRSCVARGAAARRR